MLISKSDFQIRSDRFCLCNPWNGLRILCGAALIPHALGKFADGGLNPATVGFFALAGFSPAPLWVWVAALSELVIGAALILGIATRFSALAGAAILSLAALALMRVTGMQWFWNGGGIEYLVFWTLTCLLLAQHGFAEHKRAAAGGSATRP